MLYRPNEIWAVNDLKAPQQLTQRGRIIYDDQANLADTLELNLLGKPYQHYDEAGLLIFDRYDFKVNPLILRSITRVKINSCLSKSRKILLESLR